MKYIDADRLRKEIERRIEILKKAELDWAKQGDTETSVYYSGKSVALDEFAYFIASLQQEQPEEICSKCIHHGKDDDYCYNPHSGMQSLINENGVYECTGFCEKEQEQSDVDIITEYDEQFYSDPVYGKLVNRNAGIAIARHFYELGKNSK